ncbi:hypothetical protein F4804DRAFT_338183 [Jackrogersella minutella]|nr:hypothetical protein F4804DRAFT_338183 [Jackrogersella minutella]
MSVEHLNDAAIVLHRVFSQEGIKFGIFGGFAIRIMGGLRSTKDIDCLASASKDQVVKLLHKNGGFEAISQVRDNYAAFFWDDQVNSHRPVLVEIFCEQFEGSKHSMENISCVDIHINGRSSGQGVSTFLGPFELFKGKLHAAATRSKFHDSADLRALMKMSEVDIKPRAGELNLKDVGLAVKRHPELEFLFRHLEVDLVQAKRAAKDVNLNDIQQPIAVGAVQSGLLA